MNLTAKEKRSAGSAKLWGVLLLVVLGIVLLAARSRMKPDGEQGEQPERAVPVQVQAIEPRNVTDVITIPGSVTASQHAQIPAERGGKIVEILVDKGQRVKKGQLLARLDSRLWVAQRTQAEVERREAEKDLGRWKELRKTGAVSESEYEAIRARLDLANARLEAAQVTIDQCEARSPFEGVVEEQYAELGEHVPEGGLLFFLVNTDAVTVTAQVPEKDVSSIRAGQDMAFEVSACGVTATGKVSFVAEHADAQSNSFEIEVDAANPGRVMKAGMIAKMSVVRGTHVDAVVLPLVTIVPQRGEHVAFVVSGERAERRVIKIEKKFDNLALIGAGLNAGDRVIVEGHRGLQDGDLVQVVEK